MAIQTDVVEFTASEGPHEVIFDDPGGNYAILPGTVSITSGSPASVWTDGPIEAEGAVVLNVYSSAPITGTVTVVLVELP